MFINKLAIRTWALQAGLLKLQGQEVQQHQQWHSPTLETVATSLHQTGEERTQQRVQAPCQEATVRVCQEWSSLCPWRSGAFYVQEVRLQVWQSATYATLLFAPLPHLCLQYFVHMILDGLKFVVWYYMYQGRTTSNLDVSNLRHVSLCSTSAPVPAIQCTHDFCWTEVCAVLLVTGQNNSRSGSQWPIPLCLLLHSIFLHSVYEPAVCTFNKIRLIFMKFAAY